MKKPNRLSEILVTGSVFGAVADPSGSSPDCGWRSEPSSQGRPAPTATHKPLASNPTPNTDLN